MRTRLALFALALLAACTPPQRKPQVDTAKIVDDIKADEVAWNGEWASRDADKVSAHYAPDAVVINPGAPTLSGPAAILAANKQALADPGFSLKFTSDKVLVAGSGDLAAAHGTFQATETDPKTKTVVTQTGDFVTVYKPRPDGTWQVVLDIATSGPPTSVGKAISGETTAKAQQ
jgi:uncharacterized protein (TIGR02246 family)